VRAAALTPAAAVSGLGCGVGLDYVPLEAPAPDSCQQQLRTSIHGLPVLLGRPPGDLFPGLARAEHVTDNLVKNPIDRSFRRPLGEL
jgi:hypothetical protein